MKRIVLHFLLITILVGSQSCRKNRLDPYTGGDGPEYYPLAVGNAWIYQVDSIKYNAKFGEDNDTFSYQIRNEISGEYLDNEARLNQSITRYISRDTQNWTVDGSFSILMSNLNVVRNFNNKKEIILKFPIQEFDFWDGNGLNNSTLREFEYKTVHRPYAINSKMYDSTCTVLHQNVLNRVQTFYEEFVYANHVGPISHTLIKIDEKDIDSGEPQNGFQVQYNLISFEEKGTCNLGVSPSLLDSSIGQGPKSRKTQT